MPSCGLIPLYKALAPRKGDAATPHTSAHTVLTAACTGCKCLPEIATAPLGPRNDKSGAFAILSLPNTNRRCSARSGMPLPYSARPEVCVFFILHFSVFRIHFHAPLPYNARQKASCSSPRSILVFPLPSRSSSTHNITNIFVLWKKHKNPRGNPKRSLIIPSRRDLTNAGKCDKIKAQRESGAFKNTDPFFGIARQDRFVADRLGTPAFAAGAPFFFRRGREENQNV